MQNYLKAEAGEEASGINVLLENQIQKRKS